MRKIVVSFTVMVIIALACQVHIPYQDQEVYPDITRQSLILTSMPGVFDTPVTYTPAYYVYSMTPIMLSEFIQNMPFTTQMTCIGTEWTFSAFYPMNVGCPWNNEAIVSIDILAPGKVSTYLFDLNGGKIRFRSQTNDIWWIDVPSNPSTVLVDDVTIMVSASGMPITATAMYTDNRIQPFPDPVPKDFMGNEHLYPEAKVLKIISPAYLANSKEDYYSECSGSSPKRSSDWYGINQFIMIGNMWFQGKKSSNNQNYINRYPNTVWVSDNKSDALILDNGYTVLTLNCEENRFFQIWRTADWKY